MKKILQIIICLIVGLILHILVTQDLVMLFLPSLYVYMYAHIILIIVQGAFIYCCINQIINKRLDNFSVYLLWVSYFTVLIFILFLRMNNLQGMNLNPLNIIDDISNSSLFYLTIVLNIIMIIPIGYLFKKFQLLKATLIATIFFIAIESIQYTFCVGVFDIIDIILYYIGFYIGYLLGEKIEKTLVRPLEN